MSEVKKKLKLFGQHPDKKSRLVPARGQSMHEGTVFRAVYRDKQSIVRPEFYGRLVDLQPSLEGDKVVGIQISYRPGVFTKDGWEEEQRIVTQSLGPFDSVAKTTAEVKQPTVKGEEGESDKFEVTTWALMGRASDRPCRELTFTLMESL